MYVDDIQSPTVCLIVFSDGQFDTTIWLRVGKKTKDATVSDCDHLTLRWPAGPPRDGGAEGIPWHLASLVGSVKTESCEGEGEATDA